MNVRCEQWKLKQHPDLMDGGTYYPCQNGSVESGYQGPAPRAGLVSDGGDGSDAGKIDEDEEQEAVGGQRGNI